MKALFDVLYKKPIFHMNEVAEIYGNMDSARSAIKRLMRMGRVKKIRNNLYTCVRPETGKAAADCFSIASNLCEGSYVCLRTAAEHYGLCDSKSETIYVASSINFRDVLFEDLTYTAIIIRNMGGVVSLRNKCCACITDVERTLVDCLKFMSKYFSYEEILELINRLPKLNEKKLKQYLKQCDNQFVYQKIGFFLEPVKEKVGLSDGFFDLCCRKIGKSKRYLLGGEHNGKYNDRWKMVVPV